MSVQNLFLTQQMKETQRNLENVQEIEDERRRRGGLFSSIGGGLGGAAGGLLALTLAPWTGGASLALAAGAGAAGGSLLGSRAGLELGGGKRSDATPIGMNRSALTGKSMEFGRDVKDRYRRNVGQFQDRLNDAILSTALKTGIKAAAFTFANPATATKMGNWGKSKIGMEQLGGPATIAPNIAGAQAYDPLANPSVNRLALPQSQPLQPNNMLNIATNPVSNAPVLTPDPTSALTGATTSAPPVGGVINNNITSNIPASIGSTTTRALSGQTFGGNISIIPGGSGGLQPWDPNYIPPQTITIGNQSSPLLSAAHNAANQSSGVGISPYPNYPLPQYDSRLIRQLPD